MDDASFSWRNSGRDGDKKEGKEDGGSEGGGEKGGSEGSGENGELEKEGEDIKVSRAWTLNNVNLTVPSVSRRQNDITDGEFYFLRGSWWV